MSDVTTADKFNQKYREIQSEISTVIVGQNDAVNGVLIALFCNSHALLVGVPGLAKTLLIKTISEVLDLKFNRIQFTPDLMPSDILGSEILDENRQFKFIKGPIFSNIILAAC
jgi:MoxR-like ATPase